MVMARPGRFERPTYGLEVRCSIQLSYGRNKKIIPIKRVIDEVDFATEFGC